MSKKQELRDQRKGTVINTTSKCQEQALVRAIKKVCDELNKTFDGIRLIHESQWFLSDVVQLLRQNYKDVDFHYFHKSSSMRPDGGILSIVDANGVNHPILIAEKKNQGTNDIRSMEGKPKQAKGNAIERLGKNVIGFRTAFLCESIFPFVCFGDGCDFAEDSSIIDRVVTIAMFGGLNQEYLHTQGADGRFDRGSFYFRVDEWTEEEMFDTCYSIAEKSVYYYFSKLGHDSFMPH